MAGETKNISEIANKVSREIFNFFKWEAQRLEDENFPCNKGLLHSTKEDYTHPVDIVFNYIDPYTNKRVFINTDLKSYKNASITQSNIRKSLISLAKTIDCARSSEVWRTRYASMQNDSPDVRGMLFVYNHDGEYHKKFYDFIRSSEEKKKSINLDNIKLQKGQQLHIFEPKLITYLTTVVCDAKLLHHDGTFPQKNYSFFYPDLRLHKAHGEELERPATIEILSAPYIIIKHGDVKKYDEEAEESIKTYDKGYLIYYNRSGSDYKEFIYLLDMLSNFQLLNSNNNIRIRIASAEASSEARPNFKKAVSAYCQSWGFDEHKKEILDAIEFSHVETIQKKFSSVDIGWRLNNV
ncbi:hypothetical protein [Marinobacterium stanieri]|uniref:GAPS4 PD-(D/E)XK nuclease domain-containing protein n=1 Tax=Marinobacterium stanieri TaxID=49186 RepID=A0A1N6W6G8_9GAMM|nr:hypothetical protein [Marinobacterium stanieri]SIQ85717.1 hypothetical protein SAMN05421647_11010 [Marinobacterium stanieri]